MKKPQDHKKPKKQQDLEQALKALQELRESKDLDMIAEAVWEIISAYGLTMAEVSALNYYIVERAIKSPHNAVFLNEKLRLDVETLAIDGVLQVQRALVATYLDQMKEG